MAFRPLSQTKFINDANLVAYYKLEDVNDSKNSYHLTNNGTTTFSSALFDNGADLGTSNTTKYLSIENSLGIDGGAVTIAGWVKLTTEIGAGSYDLLFQTNQTSDVSYRFIYDYNSGTRRFRFGRQKLNVAFNEINKNITMGTTDWHFVTVTYDGTTVYAYDNGVSFGGIASSGNGSGATQGTRFCIGASNTGTGIANPSSAIIDDVTVFTRALSAGEVAELYQSMTLGEYLPNSNTKLLLHLNGSSADSSGNANNGTDTAITYSQANGKFGQGAGFNGSSSQIIFPNSTALSGTGSHTISTWVKFTSLPSSGNEAWIIMKGTDYPTAGWGQGIRIFNTSGTTNFNSFCVTTSPSTVAYSANGFTISTGIWYNVVSVFNNSTQKIQLYVNGSFISETSTGTILRYANGSIIGAYVNNSNVKSSFTNGAIDEIIIENRAWSASEVKKYYTFSKGRFGIL